MTISRFCPHCGNIFPQADFTNGRCRRCRRSREQERRARHPRDRGHAFQQLRREVLDEHDNRCAAIIDGERCMETKRLEAHHINGDQSDDRKSNLTPLCRAHHDLLGHDPAAEFAMPNLAAQVEPKPAVDPIVVVGGGARVRSSDSRT